MKFEHQISVEAPRKLVWDILLDVPRAATCIPGVKDVKALGDDRYQGIMEVRVGPIGINLAGDLTVSIDNVNFKWRLEGEGRDRRVGGAVRAIIEASLDEPSEGRSELHVTTDLQFMGRLGTMGQPLIKKRAESSVKEFGMNLAKLATGA